MEAFAFDFKNENIFTLSVKAVDTVLNSGNPDAAFLLLYILRKGPSFDEEKTRPVLFSSQERYDAAIKIIKGANRQYTEDKAPEPQEIKPAKPEAEVTVPAQLNTAPSYTRLELAGAMDDPEFAFVYNLAEKAVGRPLLQYEISALMMIYDYLKLPAGVIALLVNYITRDAERRSTPEQPQTVNFRDIKTEAVRWHERGVTSVFLAEQHIDELEARRQTAWKVLRILGIVNRLPSPTEKRYIETFIEIDPTLELVALAYDLTVTRKGSLVWPYMRSVLMNWKNNGYKTPDEVRAGGLDAGQNTRFGRKSSGGDENARRKYDERVLRFTMENPREEE